MAEDQAENKSTALFTKVEPSFHARVQRVADYKYAGNKSHLTRLGIERLIEPIEAEMAEHEREARAS
jgi:hypothetical protein